MKGASSWRVALWGSIAVFVLLQLQPSQSCTFTSPSDCRLRGANQDSPGARTGHVAIFAGLFAAPGPAFAEGFSLPSVVEGVDGSSFGFGMLFGFLGAMVSVASLTNRFIQSLRTEVEEQKTGGRPGFMASKGGLIMPFFFFEGAAEVFKQVQEGASASEARFRETGSFGEIYNGIESAEKEVLLQSLEALYTRFPKSATRELIFNALRSGATASDNFASALYELSVKLQPGTTPGQDIQTELWALDENRCSVSGRRPGPGRQPWLQPEADILLDEQQPASRLTDVDMAPRPLFARVAPRILAEPTFLALVRLFDVFRPLEGGAARSGYSEEEASAIDRFLDLVIRTPVMRRAYDYLVEEVSPLPWQSSWKDTLFRIWFQQTGRGPCAFEHIFVGNLAEDATGQPVAGGLHCWLKYYLEEVRGTANFLGHFYTRNARDGFMDSRFVNGKFSWTYGTRKLVKEQGGFFVGVSPEWQLAISTVAFFESETPELAARCRWRPWTEARDTGYTRDVIHDGFQYRRVVIRRGDILLTVFNIFLGAADRGVDDRSPYPEEWLAEVSTDELAVKLPEVLVAEALARTQDSALSRECVRFCTASKCSTIEEAIQRVRGVFSFDLETAATRSRDAEVQEVLPDSDEVAEAVIAAAQRHQSNFNAEALEEVVQALKSRGWKAPRIYRPLRFLFTGCPSGAPIGVMLRLLELAENEGGIETGVPLRDRLVVIEKFMAHRRREALLRQAKWAEEED